MQIGYLEYTIDDMILTQRTLRIRVGPADVSQYMDRAATKLRRELDVPGFRKGSAPLAQVRAHHTKRVAAEAFNELQADAVRQVLKHLPAKDQPFIPPQVLELDKVKLRYNRFLEFSVKYLVDPLDITKRPEQPQAVQASLLPGGAVEHPVMQTMGIPQGPQLPKTPDKG